jgi:hypothetical protein
MRYLLIGAAAAMALVGAAAIGNAQTQDDKGKGPAAEGKGPGSAGPQREPDTGKGERSQPKSTEKAEPRRGAEKDSGKNEPRTTQQPPKDQPKSTLGSQPDKDQPKSATQPQQGKDQEKSTQQHGPGKDQPKSTESPQQGKDRAKAASPQQQLGKEPQESTKGTDQKPDARVQVSEQQRTGVRERLTKESRIERTKIKVSVNVGATIPRSVRLHTLSVAIVSFAPAYRGYSYIVLEDETICIVDERTYLIVDVIPPGSQHADRPDRAQPTLSAEQTRFIFANVPKGRATNVRVRLALGVEVPRGVELLAFPADVLRRLPEMGRYRYIVAGSDGDVVIVDPNDNAVVLVINE